MERSACNPCLRTDDVSPTSARRVHDQMRDISLTAPSVSSGESSIHHQRHDNPPHRTRVRRVLLLPPRPRLGLPASLLRPLPAQVPVLHAGGTHLQQHAGGRRLCPRRYEPDLSRQRPQLRPPQPGCRRRPLPHCALYPYVEAVEYHLRAMAAGAVEWPFPRHRQWRYRWL